MVWFRPRAGRGRNPRGSESPRSGPSRDRDRPYICRPGRWVRPYAISCLDLIAPTVRERRNPYHRHRFWPTHRHLSQIKDGIAASANGSCGFIGTFRRLRMLRKEQNEFITQTGPGTPMGELFRRYWTPALLAEELPANDCPPVRVKLFSERLVAFRDSKGRYGLIDEFCP